MIPWLGPQNAFPPIAHALAEPNGLLCAGGDLSPNRLLAAYRQGIFPWYNPGEPILWWSPAPRMVLIPSAFRLHRSLRRSLRQPGAEIRCNTAFADVIHACATSPRHGQQGTWISDEMQAAYLRLHELGWAHSVETWVEGELAGGLYGLAIGRAFFGESMFARRTDASKLALAHLARHLEQTGFGMIDCQMYTPHLASLGARPLARHEFQALLHPLVNGSSPFPGSLHAPPPTWPEKLGPFNW